MCKLILDRRDISLEYASDCMIVRSPDEQPRSLPLNQLDQVVCMHSVALTTQLIGQLHRRGIDLIVQNLRYANHGFSLFADAQKQVERRCLQYRWQDQPEIRLAVSRALCTHKFRSMARLARDNAPLGEQLNRAIEAAVNCNAEDQLRGIEGTAQRQMFAHWRSQLPAGLGFERRQRRPPPDPVNAILSLTYTLLHDEAVRQCKAHGLDSQLGFYHRLVSGRHSLACDLMESVRPRVEAWVVRLFVDGEMNKRLFSITAGQCLLGKAGRAHYYGFYEAACTDWRRAVAANARWLCRRLDSGTA